MSSSTSLLASALPAGAKTSDDPTRAKAVAAAEQFEGFFIGQMLKGMRASTRELAGADSVFKDPVNSDMQDMADHLMADRMAGQRAFGIADVILRQLLPAAAPTATAAPSPLTPPTTAGAARPQEATP